MVWQNVFGNIYDEHEVPVHPLLL